MIAGIGFITVLLSVFLILKHYMSPVPTFILIPAIASVAAGYGWQTGEFILHGMKSVAPIGIMFIFATLFFGIIISAGTLAPIIHFIFRLAGHDPIKICLGTALLAMLAETSTSGVVAVMIVVPAMMPLFDGLGMRRTTMATVLSLGAGLICTQPWGSTAQRCMLALNLTPADLWLPILLPLGVGMICVFLTAAYLGWQEKKRIGPVQLAKKINRRKPTAEEQYMEQYKRPKLAVFNVLLVLFTIAILIIGLVPTPVVFMAAMAIALITNYPNVEAQKFILGYHAKNALVMSSIVFATGSLVGIMNDTGMITAMAQAIVYIIPDSLGTHIALFAGLLGLPASLLFDPSSFYFGVLPVLAQAGAAYGVAPVEVARAAFFGQMNMGFPISPLTGTTFLLMATTRIDLAEHQKKTFPWAFGITIIMLVTAIAIGAITP
ncbi:MAG: citrate:proton symporter [Megasphaera sp.]|jgi:CitMHS family citrate-Mg2+:H+ or citrate-Ca2+:H+ symporter|nr:citrate:proton symporter [Megasphaera sp.]